MDDRSGQQPGDQHRLLPRRNLQLRSRPDRQRLRQLAAGHQVGTKYEDPNADGDLSDGIGLENWTINVYADDGDGVLSASEYGAGAVGSGGTTDSNGDYTVSGLDPGDYIACEVSQSGWSQSYPTSGADCTGSSGATDLGDVGWAFSITSGQDETGNDFGNWQQGTKSGTKYEDPNADGDLSDGIGLENWTINVYADDGDGVLSASEYGAGAVGSGGTTDSNGDYTVSGLDPGDYIACEVSQSGWSQSYPTSGADCTGSSGATDLGDVGWAFSLTSGEDETGNDFGNWQQGTKSGTKYEDPNQNGVWDLGELGLAGWTIKVFSDVDSSGTLTALDTEVASTTTADGSGALALGAYEFMLDPGDYLVCEVQQATWTQTYPANSVCDNATVDATLAPAGYAITISSGSTDEGNDFGNFVQPTRAARPASGRAAWASTCGMSIRWILTGWLPEATPSAIRSRRRTPSRPSSRRAVIRRSTP